MKPANFPERQNERRRRALVRIGYSASEALKLYPSARDVRTKKKGPKELRRLRFRPKEAA